MFGFVSFEMVEKRSVITYITYTYIHTYTIDTHSSVVAEVSINVLQLYAHVDC